MRTCLIAVVGSLLWASAAAAADAPTFYKDVLPILQANCQTLPPAGRSGADVALTYEQARPWARAIKTAVVVEADAAVVCRSRLRPLRERAPARATREIDTHRGVGRCRRAGRRSENDAPPPLTFASGWNIKPDIIVEMPKPFELPARGTVNYKYILVEGELHGGHVGDRGRDAARRSRRSCITARSGCGRPDRTGWRTPCPAKRTKRETQPRHPRARTRSRKATTSSASSIPGLGAQRFDMDGAAKFIPKGSDLVFELHYTTSGKPTPDVSKLGLVLAKEPPQTRYFFHAGPTALNLAIPAGRRQSGSRQRDHVRRGRAARLRAAAHASARQGLRAARRLARQADRRRC